MIYPQASYNNAQVPKAPGSRKRGPYKKAGSAKKKMKMSRVEDEDESLVEEESGEEEEEEEDYRRCMNDEDVFEVGNVAIDSTSESKNVSSMA